MYSSDFKKSGLESLKRNWGTAIGGTVVLILIGGMLFPKVMPIISANGTSAMQLVGGEIYIIFYC